MNQLLQIALNHEGKIVSIYEVETGIKCNCFCPECGETLEAKNKDKTEKSILTKNQKQAHFAHASGKNCKYAAETAIHKLAKEVLKSIKRLRVPEYKKWGVLLSESNCYDFDEVLLEKPVIKDGIHLIPDAILKKGNDTLYVEFYKTHIVDDIKLQKIKLFNTSTIEIDLNSLDPIKDGKPNYSEVEIFLTEETLFSEWLHNSKHNKLYKKSEERSRLKYIENDKLEIIQQVEEKKKNLLELEKNTQKEEAIERWKNNALKRGYELLKVYFFKSEMSDIIFCPKLLKPKNKIDLGECRFCKHYLGLYYKIVEEKGVLCGYKAKIEYDRI